MWDYLFQDNQALLQWSIGRSFWNKKSRKLIAEKYFRFTPWQDVEAYIKGYDTYLASKTIYYKLYGDLQLLSISTHCWKDSTIDFVIGLPLLVNWKSDNYDVILVIINCLTKIVHYEPVKITINVAGLTEVTINIVMRHDGFLRSIRSNRGFLFTLKFLFLLCYFFGIKQKLYTAFHPEIDGNMINAYSKKE